MSPWWLLVLLLTLGGLSLLAWSLRALDAPGAAMAFLVGLVVALSAGLGWLVLMSLFSALGATVTVVGKRRKAARGAAEERDGERGVPNVLANGTAALLAALSIHFVAPEVAALAFASAVAAVTADTMASELGALGRGARRIVPPFDLRPPGENGCVSWVGQFSAVLGAGVIALAAVPLLGLPLRLAWIPALAGWLGCQLDSVLGATLERDAIHPDRPLGKESVNFLASLVPAVVVTAIAVGFF